MQYITNFSVYQENLQKKVVPVFSWTSMHKILGISGNEKNSFGNVIFPIRKNPQIIDSSQQTVGMKVDNSSVTRNSTPVKTKKTENNSSDVAASVRNLTKKTQTISVNKEIPLCPLVPPKLVGRLKVMKDCPPFKELEALYPELQPGGRFKPNECLPRYKVAIIIPYRDREEHLRIFLHNIHPMLMRQHIDYGVYVVEQAGSGRFNRAMLMNIGYVEALKQYSYDCFIFHDVDLIPEDDRNLYTCPEQPRHMSVAVNTMQYRLPYKDIFGGVSALTKHHMESVNGFSNQFWGWGGEDDDMSNRIRHHGYKISRYPANIARYHMLTHKKDNPNPDRYKKLYKGRIRYKTDGLNSLTYKRLDLILKKLYTWVLVEINPS